jgi:alpha,alpha-trehalose phosphorylase
MLEYRFLTINKARDRAREMSHKKGALFSWRTIAGEECSAFFPSGTAQYHINADIAYAIKLYYEATEDEEFITKYGAEIVMETARIWMDLGAYIARKNNKFCINAVTGPDEYTVLVDNNFYTNAMAQMHLSFAAGLAAKLKTENPEEYRRITEIMQLNESEPAEWLRAAKSMNLPYDDQLGIHPQDDTFLSKKIWNPAETPREPHLPLHHHYLVIYRHQVCKQADVVLAMFLLGDRFNVADKKRDYDYYEPITTHDSSLSYCTFSVIASEIGYAEQAYDHFMQTARMDLDNIQGNSSYGVHVAAMGGTWMAIVNGFAGMRAYNGKLSFAPHLPSAWQSYSFKILFKGQLLHIQVDANEVRYRLLTGEAIEFEHDKLQINLTKDYPIKVVPTNGETGLGKQSNKQEARERVDV